jgi:hypothetical protein
VRAKVECKQRLRRNEKQMDSSKLAVVDLSSVFTQHPFVVLIFNKNKNQQHNFFLIFNLIIIQSRTAVVCLPS